MIPRRDCGVLAVAGLAALVALAAPGRSPAAGAQDPPTVERLLRGRPAAPEAQPWRSRLLEVDHLIRLENFGRAATMLEEAEKLGAPRAETLPRWVALAVGTGDDERAADLCREGLRERPGQLRLLRALAGAEMARGRLPEARAALDELFAASPNRATSVADAVGLWRAHGHPAEALALCDSLRAAQGDARVFQRQRAACLLELDRVEDGVAEAAGELAANPLNLPLVRDELLDLLPARSQRERAVAALAQLDRDAPAARLLRAELLLRLGRADAAAAATADLADDPAAAQVLLHAASILAKELPLETEAGTIRPVADWLLATLEKLAGSAAVPRGQQLKVLDLLAGVCEDVLVLDTPGPDRAEAARRLDAVLELVRARSPGSTRLYSARIRLAAYTRDVLGRPAEAAATLERLLVDLDLPLEGVALARLALGETYLAARDTARARTVLTRLGRSPQYRDAAGRAHYLLALLDFAQGGWETARDRLASVALDGSASDVANDALDLGLLIAEELMQPTGGPSRLAAYAPAVGAALVRDDAARLAALQAFVRDVAGDAAEDRLLDRVRLELAETLLRAGDADGAASQCRLVSTAHPSGPLAPRALLREGAALVAAGRAQDGRAAWERLLLQYPDALEAEDARLELRSSP
ncbi:MAG: hypothetical protein IPH09_06595 [bacterium]|nr:hypothetical protein [bacterium]